MRIGLSGTVSVGKTTLIKELAKLEQFKDYYVATERSKYLRDLGIPLNNDSTVRGQLVFMAERSSELLKENLLTDRTIWDVCAFTLSSKTISHSEKIALVNAGMCLKDYYDIVFYIDPEGVEIEDNNVRSIDPKYRNDIDYCIKEILKEYAPKRLVSIKGTVDERISTILSCLN
jgi:nicotinamide riboside kinase